MSEKSKKKKGLVLKILGAILVVVAIVLVITLLIVPAARKSSGMKTYGDALANASVGDTVTFGHYEEDGDPENGKEPISWTVLDKEDGKILVIAENGIDSRYYNDQYVNVTWQSSSIRQWLNETFASEAFTPEERAIIDTTTVSTADSVFSEETEEGDMKTTEIDGGADTKDKLFLLEIEEVKTYFPTEEARKIQPTAYAIQNGASVKLDNGGAWWWLRNPGDFENVVAIVKSDGTINEKGNQVDHGGASVRPAMWILTK